MSSERSIRSLTINWILWSKRRTRVNNAWTCFQMKDLRFTRLNESCTTATLVKWRQNLSFFECCINKTCFDVILLKQKQLVSGNAILLLCLLTPSSHNNREKCVNLKYISICQRIQILKQFLVSQVCRKTFIKVSEFKQTGARNMLLLKGTNYRNMKVKNGF